MKLKTVLEALKKHYANLGHPLAVKLIDLLEDVADGKEVVALNASAPPEMPPNT